MKKIVALFVALTMAVSGQASEWVSVAKYPNGSKIYLDKSSRIFEPKENTVTVWVKGDSIENKSTATSNKGKIENSYKHKITFYCSRNSLRLLRGITYDASGNVLVDTTGALTGMTEIVPDSLGELLYKAVCTNPEWGIMIQNELWPTHTRLYF